MTPDPIHLVKYLPSTRKAILIIAACGTEDGLKMTDYPTKVTCPECLKLMLADDAKKVTK